MENIKPRGSVTDFLSRVANPAAPASVLLVDSGFYRKGLKAGG